MSENIDESTEAMWKYWRTRVFITSWIAYMTYYIGRVHIGIAKPFILAEFPEIGIVDFGLIGTTFFVMYAIGQFVNGTLGDKFGARRIVTLGLIVSSFLNLLFGFSNGLVWMMFLLWGINGYFQAMGWAPSVKTVANWMDPNERGKWSSLLGTSYQVGGAVSWILATLIIVTLKLDWRVSFWVAGIILLVSGIHNYIRSRNAPEEVGLPTLEEAKSGIDKVGDVRKDVHLGFEHTIKSIISNKTVLYAAFGLFCLNIVRYGISEWLPYLIAEEVRGDDFFSLWKTIAFPIGGTIGALATAWFSDKYLQKRRMFITSILFFALAGSMCIYLFVPPLDFLFGGPLLILIGFLTFGPHVLLVSTIPMEFGTRKSASTATGFIDGWGYVGSAFTTVFTPWLITTFGVMDNATPLQNVAFYFWIIMAVVGGFVLLFNRKSVPEKQEYF